MEIQINNPDFAQPENQLSAIAAAERQKLFPRNDYSPESDKYSSTHPDANADGDLIGRGTGNFLDVNNENAGTQTDKTERKEDIKINKYNSNRPYYIPA